MHIMSLVRVSVSSNAQKSIAFIIYHKKYIQIENPESHVSFLLHFAIRGGMLVGHNAIYACILPGGAILPVNSGL